MLCSSLAWAAVCNRRMQRRCNYVTLVTRQDVQRLCGLHAGASVGAACSLLCKRRERGATHRCRLPRSMGCTRPRLAAARLRPRFTCVRMGCRVFALTGCLCESPAQCLTLADCESFIGQAHARLILRCGAEYAAADFRLQPSEDEISGHQWAMLTARGEAAF